MTSRPPRLALFLAVALATVPPATAQTPPLERVKPNDNRARAGISMGTVVAVRLEARLAMWHPNGDEQPGAPIPVFAESGRQAQVPGPMIRVPGGTDVIITIRNALPADTLTIHGLHARPVAGAQGESVTLAPRAARTLRFRLDRPGTYYYWGTTTGRAFRDRYGADAQLTGAIVVDEPGVRTPRDRIFVIGMWADTNGSELSRHRQRELFVINGRAWPHTDRLLYEQGDSVAWRVINASADAHPMHLHGFYFRVTRRGDGRADTVQTVRDLVHTERLSPGATMSMSWRAERLGNWLFHCHVPAHVTARGPMGLPRERPVVLAQAGSLQLDRTQAMGGVVAGVEIRRAEGDTATTMPAPPEPVRRVRMHLRPSVGSTPSRPLYSVAFDEAGAEPSAPETGVRAGPPLVLTRGEPVSITVLNGTPEATSLHWHGIELESFYDGVPGFSGIRPMVAPEIAPNDSFEVRFAPPRAGTFIYHAQLDEQRQQRAGIVGALMVVEKGGHDPARDVPVLVSSPSDSVEEERAVLVNGSMAPLAVTLRPAMGHRLRLINITTGRPTLRYELWQDSTLVTWRPLAKDGADVSASRRVVRPARQVLGIGETMDVEFFPTRAGLYRLEIRTPLGTLLGTMPLRVQ